MSELLEYDEIMSTNNIELYFSNKLDGLVGRNIEFVSNSSAVFSNFVLNITQICQALKSLVLLVRKPSWNNT